MKQRRFFPALLAGLPLFLLFSAGFFISQKSWMGNIVVYLNDNQNSRNIASVKSDMSVSGTHFKLLNTDQQSSLLSHSQIQNTNESIEFHLGHLLVPSQTTTRALACQEYTKVELSFVAEGITIHGHVPTMTIQAPCRFNPKTAEKMGPFIIPKKHILSAPVSQEVFSGPFGTFIFDEVALSWPKKWVLKNLRFFHPYSNKSFTVSLNLTKQDPVFTLLLK